MKRATPVLLAALLAVFPASAARAADVPSCEEVSQAYVDEQGMKTGGPADLQVSDFASILNRGSYLDPCEVPMTSAVDICAAVQKGKVVGITVHVQPADATLETCVADAVVALSFPDHPRMDVVRTKFAPQDKGARENSESSGEGTAADGSVDAPPKVPPKSGGCGCSTTRSTVTNPTSMIAVALAVAFVRRRARRSFSAG